MSAHVTFVYMGFSLLIIKQNYPKMLHLHVKIANSVTAPKSNYLYDEKDNRIAIAAVFP